jgi:hypothetical protein
LRVIKNKNIQFEEFNNYLPILNGKIIKNGHFKLVSKDDILPPLNTPVYRDYLDITAGCSDIDDLIEATSGFFRKYLVNSELALFLYNEDKRNYSGLNLISEDTNSFVDSLHKDALIDWLIETGKPKILPDPRTAKINGTSTNYLLYHSREDLKKKLIVIKLQHNLSEHKINSHIDTLENIFRLFFVKSDNMILEKELKLLYNELHVYQSKLSNDFKLSAIGELTAGIVEEILTPLQIIISNAEFLNSDDSNKIFIFNIKDQVTKIGDLVTRVLKFANVEDCKVSLNSVNINNLLTDYYKMISSSLESEKYECILNLDKHIPTILSNSVYMNQIFSNIFSLIRNGDKTNGCGILVQTKYLNEKIQVRVVLTKKLKDLEKDDETSQEYKLLKNLMLRHEGNIRLENIKNSGSTLILTFPLKRCVRQ